MSIKNELILSYIKELEPGTKLSVRRLSELLGVSEGTVYKAIKTAEAQGLVVTKPKSGTFRVDSGLPGTQEPLTLGRIAKLLGLATLVHPKDSGKRIDRFLVCDGSPQQISEVLCSKDCGNALCLVGRRPDIHELCIENGADILLTSGASADAVTLIRAEQHGLCVMTALQDSCTVLHLLQSQLGERSRDCDSVKDWMRAPSYLYTNDVVADWHKLSESGEDAMPVYPIVDENHAICGVLDIPRAFAANHSQRISGIMRPASECMRFSEDASMHRIAEEMILSGSHCAAVTDGGRMSGAIDSLDLLRYFVYSGSEGHAPMFESFLESTDVSGSESERFFSIRFPQNGKEDPAEFTLPVVLAAAHRHARELLGAGCVVESGTFFSSKPIDYRESLMLSSRVTRSAEGSCTLETEIFDSSCSYTKAILMFTKENRNVLL